MFIGFTYYSLINFMFEPIIPSKVTWRGKDMIFMAGFLLSAKLTFILKIYKNFFNFII